MRSETTQIAEYSAVIPGSERFRAGERYAYRLIHRYRRGNGCDSTGSTTYGGNFRVFPSTPLELSFSGTSPLTIAVGGTGLLHVNRAGSSEGPLLVNFTSSDVTVARVPASIDIEIGRSGGDVLFGILVSRELVDELVYNEKGNKVILIKHLAPEVAA